MYHIHWDLQQGIKTSSLSMAIFCCMWFSSTKCVAALPLVASSCYVHSLSSFFSFFAAFSSWMTSGSLWTHSLFSASTLGCCVAFFTLVQGQDGTGSSSGSCWGSVVFLLQDNWVVLLLLQDNMSGVWLREVRTYGWLMYDMTWKSKSDRLSSEADQQDFSTIWLFGHSLPSCISYGPSSKNTPFTTQAILPSSGLPQRTSE